MQLKDKVAIVTGGARGIGEGIARGLAAAGARVALIDIDGAAAALTARELGHGALGIGADVSDESAAREAVAQVVKAFGTLDILVNNAGGGKPGAGIGNPFTRIAQDAWDEQITTNLRTVFATTKAAIPQLRERGGSIVNISSVAGQMPSPTTPAYGAAKAAVIALTRSLALELAAQDIRVNAICPGLLWTRAWETLAAMMKAGMPQFAALSPREIFLDRVKRLTPLGREQTPEDIAQLTVFLCSDAARNITGQCISVDGGLTLKGGGA